MGRRWRIQEALSHFTLYTSVCAFVVVAIWTIFDYDGDFLGLRTKSIRVPPPISGEHGLSLVTVYVKVTHL